MGAAVEIQALLRAHQVSGDNDLGIEFLLMADYPAFAGRVSNDAVKEIRRIKARVDAERLPWVRTRRCTPNSDAAASPTSSGRCN